jgi:Ca2+-binding EF-hand superfamily protein
MKIKIPSTEITQVFDHLDTNKDGFIDYTEFCGLCEEKRRDIDPFEMPIDI